VTAAQNPTLLSSNLWASREAHFTRVVLRGLEILATRAPSGNENAINREFYFCLLRASRELDPEGIYPPPVTECCNQPDPDDPARAANEAKRPDFTWSYLDPHEPDPTRSSIQFIMECKRLGRPTSPQWILNSNYVEHGVHRFIHPQWAYAKRFPSALMIGYWESMGGDELLAEVNVFLEKKGLPDIALSPNGWQTCSTTQLYHLLLRPFPKSPFSLKHLWLDLRGLSPPRS
jgi:hypothetical protein